MLRATCRATIPRTEAAAKAVACAAPYFDEVTVRDLDETAPGVYTVRTHARTNGVEATWRIVADAEGVRAARWTATASARRPFEPEFEGLTALPGADERYRLLPHGLLRAIGGLPGRGTVFRRPR